MSIIFLTTSKKITGLQILEITRQVLTLMMSLQSMMQNWKCQALGEIPHSDQTSSPIESLHIKEHEHTVRI